MPDELLDVVFVYDSLPDEHFDVVDRDVEYAVRPGEIEHGDINGLIHAIDADAGALGSPDLPRIEFRLEENHFVVDEPTFEEPYEKRFDRFCEVIRAIYGAGDRRPEFVYALQYHMDQAVTEIEFPPVDADTLANDRINYAVWLNVFPPRLVETYGRDRLLSAPAWRTEEYDDGAVLVVAHREPLGLDSFGALNDHLGLDDPGL